MTVKVSNEMAGSKVRVSDVGTGLESFCFFFYRLGDFA